MPLPAGSSGHGGRGRGISAEQRQTSVLEMYRGRAKLAVIRDMAMGEWSDREIAEQLGVKVVDVVTFREMHSDEISEVRMALAGKLAIETAGLWVSKRQNRVAELQADIEELEGDIQAVKAVYGPGTKEHVNLLRTKLLSLRAVADEYLPARRDKAEDAAEQGNRVHYILEADDSIIESLT